MEHRLLVPCTSLEGNYYPPSVKPVLINFRTKFDYDRWASYGGEQWKAENVLPIFAELEDNSLRNVDNMTEFLIYPMIWNYCELS